MQINTKKIICVENEFGQNTYIVEFEDCCVIVDAGINIKNVKSITNKPITAVFITHGHFDHIKNIEDYDKLNVPIYADEHIIEMLVDENKNASKLFNQLSIYKVKNLKFVQDAEKIKINEHTIKCLQTKGHSIDGLCFLLDNEMLFSGDTLFADSVGRNDLPTGNKNELIKSFCFVGLARTMNQFNKKGNGKQEK